MIVVKVYNANLKLMWRRLRWTELVLAIMRLIFF